VAKFVLTRLVETIPVLLLSSLLVFAILHLIPGDPIDAMLGAAAFGVGDPVEHQRLVTQIRTQLGLDDPLWQQYVRWLFGAVRLDLGESFIRHAPVTELIAARLPSTIELALAHLLRSWGIAPSALIGHSLGAQLPVLLERRLLQGRGGDQVAHE